MDLYDLFTPRPQVLRDALADGTVGRVIRDGEEAFFIAPTCQRRAEIKIALEARRNWQRWLAVAFGVLQGALLIMVVAYVAWEIRHGAS